MRACLNDERFVAEHRSNSKDFSRKRKLSFSSLFILIFRKSVKSGQLILNEFVSQFNLQHSITSSAYSQARKKLSYTAFKELSNGITSIFYDESSNIVDFHGYRCLSFDGSKIRLPLNKALEDIYGIIQIKNQRSKDLGCIVSASVECCYDVLNKMVLDFRVEHYTTSESSMILAMLPGISGKKDILLLDRYYASYKLIAMLEELGKEYVIRCKNSWYKSIQNMFNPIVAPDQLITLKLDKRSNSKAAALNPPSEIIVRAVRVRLDNGNYEVLITSKNNHLSIEKLKHLYNLRWGIETLFSYIKNHLSVENFTGTTPEAILQDIWATILITNLESAMTCDVNEAIPRSSNKYAYIVNKSVSFNSIKQNAFEIFMLENNPDIIIQKLIRLFLTKLTPVRNGRSFPRTEPSSRGVTNYLRYKRKHVF